MLQSHAVSVMPAGAADQNLGIQSVLHSTSEEQHALNDLRNVQLHRQGLGLQGKLPCPGAGACVQRAG